MKPVTAETITDEQIRELLREAEGIERNDVDLARLCTNALGHGSARVGSGLHFYARERCAATWNARHKETADAE